MTREPGRLALTSDSVADESVISKGQSLLHLPGFYNDLQYTDWPSGVFCACIILHDEGCLARRDPNPLTLQVPLFSNVTPECKHLGTAFPILDPGRVWLSVETVVRTSNNYPGAITDVRVSCSNNAKAFLIKLQYSHVQIESAPGYGNLAGSCSNAFFLVLYMPSLSPPHS